MLPLAFLYSSLFLSDTIPSESYSSDLLIHFIRNLYERITSLYNLRQLCRMFPLFGDMNAIVWSAAGTCYVNCFPRCYNKMNFFPDTEYSVWCTMNSTLRGPDGIEFVVACCDHSDYCNRDLRPSFPTYESRGQSYSRFANHLEGGTINRS